MTPPFALSASRTPAHLEVITGPGTFVELEGLADVAVVTYGTGEGIDGVTFAAWVLAVTEDQLMRLGTVPGGGLSTALVLPDGRRVAGRLLGGSMRPGHFTLRGTGIVSAGPVGPISPTIRGPFDE